MASTDTTTLGGEYDALTRRCALVDRSERGKLALTGADAVEFLGGQVTNELGDLRPGEGRYAAFLTHKGKMLGDLRILAAGTDPDSPPDELLLDTERSALQALFDMIRRFKVGYRVELHKRTLESKLLSLVGPEADEVVHAARGSDAPSQLGETHHDFPHGTPQEDGSLPKDVSLPEREHSHVLARIGSAPVRLIRTDLGIDALFDSPALAAVREALETAGAAPVSEGTVEIVRVESGRPRYGLDIDESTIPQEAGLNERAVSFTKGCYVGQETVARLYYRGKPNRHLRGLRLSEPALPGAELRLAERPVGRLGSSVVSPRLGPIALALVRREAEPGATVSVGESGATASVVELPFQ
jgi:folate-binding protein YgfZ